ncbi:VPLPA-CTERM sorting domain-containing protein [Rhodovulum sp. DZ06]|uniref:VPLPA-CTERM sorting domain-containing protein n=1 Tax=Rhodovulum sp. DZ06 TaxID=3425126 RepID=UPI003D33C3CD
MLRALAVCSALLAPGAALGLTTVTVDGTASGGFGVDVQEIIFTPLAAGPALTGGTTYRFRATGQVDTGSGFSGPEGIFFDFAAVSSSMLTPLQEAAGLTSSAATDVAGGLMAMFVETGELPVADAFDVDAGGDLSVEGLFYVGAMLLFTAPTDGQVFFGVNDLRPGNNIGAFEVTVGEVPLPAGAALLLSGIGGLAAFRRRAA